MRHVWSLIAGVLAAPLAWLLLATGQSRWQTTVDDWQAAGTYDTTAELVGPAVALAAVGILLGLLATLRWSPAGPVVAGALLTVPAVLMLITPLRMLDEAPDDWRLFGQDLAPRVPLQNGTLLVVGILLLMAAFSGQRWRRWPVAATGPQASETAPETQPEATEPAAETQPAATEPAPDIQPAEPESPGSDQTTDEDVSDKPDAPGSG
jgi:hypothetical protein